MADVKFRRERELICVHYPGVVQNTARMIETLGGLSTISKVHADSSRRLELRYRPDDVYSKPAFADRLNTTSVLMKIVRKRKCPKGKILQNPIYEAEVLGVIGTTYRFRNIMDYQYLPMKRNESGYEALLDKLVPQSLVPSSWLNQEMDLFLVPPLFSRLENPADFLRPDPQPRHSHVAEFKTKEKQSSTFGKCRARRSVYTLIFNYDDKSPVPIEPHQMAVQYLELKLKDCETVAKVKNAFEEQPIWSRNALSGKGIAPKVKLRTILPAIAYYCMGGPWRGLWVKFGYDPRKHPEAKMYQLLDFRVRQNDLTDKILARRKCSSYNFPMKLAQSQAKVSVIQKVFDPDAGSSETGKTKDIAKQVSLEAMYLFKPGVIPACRQMFYQLCDVHLDEVQKLLHSTDGNEEKCAEGAGWLKPAILEQCRDHIKKYLHANDANQDDTLEEQQQEEDMYDEEYDDYEDEESMMEN